MIAALFSISIPDTVSQSSWINITIYKNGRDTETGTALLTRLDNPGNILMVDAGDDSHGLWQLLNGNTKEWAVYGRRIRAEILLLKPLELEEIAIK